MKPVDRLKFLPSHFTEDDKIEYELLCDDAKRIFKNIKDEWLIHLSVIAYINEQKGLKVEATDEQIAEVMSRYDLSSSNLVLHTPVDENFKIEDTLKPVIQAEVHSVVNNSNIAICEE